MEKKQSLWVKLLGNPDEFSMENRAFNYVSVVTFFLLLISLIFDIYLCISEMSFVIIGLLVLLVVLYYFSRYKRKYKVAVATFIVCSYTALAFNYFVNSGINGPTICMFFITFVFLVILGKPSQYGMWAVLHIGIVSALLLIEYYYPDFVPDTYPSRKDRFLDMGLMCSLAIIFIFTLVNYLRNYYNAKSQLADERAKAIEQQNIHISAQNRLLEKVNNEKNKLFSIVSHDLKSPMDSIKGYLTLLSDETINEDEKKLLQHELLIQTNYTTHLLMNLTSWTKTQMHGVTVNLTNKNLQSFIEEIINNKQTFTARKNIKLTAEIDPGIDIICDEDMFHIVIRNIVNNAIKFTHPGGSVHISAAVKGGKAVISVQDTGIGISPSVRQSVFSYKSKPMYGTNMEKGIGLGLLMCKEFLDYQQGEIWFESEVGIGTTFHISLPLAQNA